MKTSVKALAAGVALACGVQAQAAINPDNAFSLFTGTGDGELFLSAIDRGGSVQRSYVRDLGITSAAFLANDASYVNNISIAADANLQDILNNRTGNIAWNLAAAYNLPDANYNGIGYLSTSPTNLTSNNVPWGYGGFNSAIGNIGIYLQSVNGVNTDYAVNISQIFPQAANAFYDNSWGDMWNGSHGTEAPLGNALDFYYVYLNDALADTTAIHKMLGQWTLAADGTLTYSAATVGAPVPVPAAVWLLGSALVGLVGVARRKTEQPV
jgi:hypothetical protein